MSADCCGQLNYHFSKWKQLPQRLAKTKKSSDDTNLCFSAPKPKQLNSRDASALEWCSNDTQWSHFGQVLIQFQLSVGLKSRRRSLRFGGLHWRRAASSSRSNLHACNLSTGIKSAQFRIYCERFIQLTRSLLWFSSGLDNCKLALKWAHI